MKGVRAKVPKDLVQRVEENPFALRVGRLGIEYLNPANIEGPIVAHALSTVYLIIYNVAYEGRKLDIAGSPYTFDNIDFTSDPNSAKITVTIDPGAGDPSLSEIAERFDMDLETLVEFMLDFYMWISIQPASLY